MYLKSLCLCTGLFVSIIIISSVIDTNSEYPPPHATPLPVLTLPSLPVLNFAILKYALFGTKLPMFLAIQYYSRIF